MIRTTYSRFLARTAVMLLAVLCNFTGARAQEAYACYTPSNTTLTFYYDNQRSSRGTTYDMNTGYNSPGWYEIRESITKVVFHSSFANARPTSCNNWFYGMKNLTSITGLNDYLNTSEVTNMYNMFRGCSGLTSLDLSTFNTTNVTSIAYMFRDCSGLTSLDLSHFNISSCTSLNHMFSGCTNLTSLDLSSFHTANVTEMSNMFSGCSSLTTIYVGNGWNTTAVTSSNVFTDCTSLVGGSGTTYDANHVNAAYARIDGGTANPGYFTKSPEAYAEYTSDDTTLTFYYDNLRSTRTGTTYSLNTEGTDTGWETAGINANVTKVVFDTSFANARPTTTYSWFYDMQLLQSITGMEYLNTSEVTNMRWMFGRCFALNSLDLSHFNTAKVTNMSLMFNNCSSLTMLDLSSFNTAKVNNMQSMFYGCSNLTTIFVSDGWNTDAVASSDGMFTDCTNLVGYKGTTYDENHVDAAYAHIDGGESNPGYLSPEREAYAEYNADNATLTFYYDILRSTRSGTTYDLNTGVNTPGWYNNRTSFTSVVFDSSFSDARPTSCRSWFQYFSNLSSITGLNYLNTSNVTNLQFMFCGCHRLTSLDVSHFNTSNVTDMRYMFCGCYRLTSLDLSSFNTANVTDMTEMFRGCSGLTTIFVGDGWKTTAVTSSDGMFTDCTSIVGGSGTTYDANHVTAAYAHIDGGESNPGYLIAEGAEPWIFDEAYAEYTADNTTLTFYYDKLRSTRTGTTYGLKTLTPGWYSDNTKASVTQVVFHSSFADARPTSCQDWFRGMENLTSITGMEYLNTSEVTSMDLMFYNCKLLTNIDLSHFNTANVKNMNCMFWGCSGLTKLDLSRFNTANVADMGYMFKGCSGLTSLDLSSFNTSKVKYMGEMFRDCSDLSIIYVDDGWSTDALMISDQTAIRYMFLNCTKLVGGSGTRYDGNHTYAGYAHIDGGLNNPGYLTQVGEAYAVYTSSNSTLTFYYDKLRSTREDTYGMNDNPPGWWRISGSITSVVFDSSFANARPTTCFGWFRDMENLTSITGLNYLNTTDVTYMGAMFLNCTSLTSLDLSRFNTSKVTEMYNMFNGCSNLTTIYGGYGWNTDAVTSSDGMFLGCTQLVGGNGTTYDASHVDAAYACIDGGTDNPGYFTEKFEVYAVYTSSNSTLTFYYDPLRITRTGAVYDLNTETNNPGWYTNRTNITSVVFNSSFADARPTSCHYWFCGMENLTSIEGMEYFNTANVTYMYYMFANCSKLTSLDLSNFNTAKAKYMGFMFYGCSGLTNLDLSSFNTAKVWSMVGMFEDCSNLTTIYVGDGWSTAAVTSSGNMFSGCTKLVGGDGTTYNAAHVDVAYAHIDGNGGPGYFTEKPSEAYAVYTADNTTLTFYYDKLRRTRTGTTYELKTTAPGWYSDNTYTSVTQVVFDSSFADARPTSCYRWFYGMENLTSITGMEYLNTSEVTNMAGMFLNCFSLTSLDLSHFNTAKVTNMAYMFYGCYYLTRLDLSSFNTANVTNMYAMFAYCYLTRLDLSSFNTANVTNMQYMFYGCAGLTTIHVGDHWSTAAVTSSDEMFLECTHLVGGNGTTYNPNHVDAEYAHIDGGTSTPGYFTDRPETYAVYTENNTTLTFYCDNLRNTRGTTYDLNIGENPSWLTDGAYTNVTQVVFDPSFANAHPTSCYCWFYGMENLTSITGMEYLNTVYVEDMLGMFADCHSLTSLDLSSFNTANVICMSGLFYGCAGLTSLDLSSFNTANVLAMRLMFSDCTNLTTIYVGDGWSTAAIIKEGSEDMFTECTSLVGGNGTIYDENHVDATYARIDGGTSTPGYFTPEREAYAVYDNATLTFYYDNLRSTRTATYSLNKGEVEPYWLTDGAYTNVTQVVFYPSFADARPTSCLGWFYRMENLTSITGMEYLNTTKVTNMGYMFYGCTSLTSLDLRGFNTANVLLMNDMFADCTGLTSLNVSSFNTANVLSLSYMFSKCTSLTSLDLSSFNTAKVWNMEGMFDDCTNLTTIYAGDGWSTDGVDPTERMFYGCTNLVGGNGTEYSSSHTDADYAHIDGGPDNPGYFSEKPPFIPGDANDDGTVSVADAVAVVAYLLNPSAATINLEAADVDGVEGVTIGDVQAIVNMILQ